MLMDYIENVSQFLVILFALLISVTRYISTQKRSWLCTAGFFSGYFLSCYLWTSHLVVMHEQPIVFDFITNLGWNSSFVMLLLLILQMKSKEELKYLHPMMLLPVFVNVPQLILYTGFDGVANSIYQCTICTVISCLAMQNIMWYVKHRKDGATKPYIAVIMLIEMATEFGMWTFSCFGGWLGYMYYPSSFLCTISFFMLVWAVRRTYPINKNDDDEIHLDKKIKLFFQSTYVVVVLSGCIGGILLVNWIKGILTDEETGEIAESAYTIIPMLLFMTSVVLAIFAIVTILIVYFEQKATENHKLREARKIAEHSNAAKSDFLANMSHEIRTPINAVLGMNKLVMRECVKARNSPPDNRELSRKLFSELAGYSRNIDSAGNNLLFLINDILDFSKIEAGKLEITEREYMLGSVFNDVSNTVLFRAKDKGLEYHVEIADDIPEIMYGDEVRVRQIITNILNNAVKYTEKGSVTLFVRGDENGFVEGKTATLIVSVKDTGIGIKKEAIETIFAKFERTDMERNSTVEGTGLGLAITKQLLRLMGGRIEVESEYGKGSTFTVYIPQKVVSAEPIGNFREKFEKSMDDVFASDNLFRAPDAHILIVDDTRMNLTVAVGLLNDTEIKADTAESGAEALEMTMKNRYDLILMDQRMPGMDGTQALKLLREQKNGMNAETIVICLTADAIAGAKERYISEGFTDYLSKPIDSGDLKKMLMKYLPQEKVIPISAEEIREQAESAQTAEADPVYEALESAGINTRSGLGYCQNIDDLYRSLLLEYVQSADEKTQKLRRFRETGDLENYAIIVHSLKSTSRTIGAAEISEMAEKLEKAANERRMDYISYRHDDLLELYGKAVSAIAAAMNVSAETSAPDDDDDDIMEFMPK